MLVQGSDALLILVWQPSISAGKALLRDDPNTPKGKDTCNLGVFLGG
jgi:hypothetical protein